MGTEMAWPKSYRRTPHQKQTPNSNPNNLRLASSAHHHIKTHIYIVLGEATTAQTKLYTAAHRNNIISTNAKNNNKNKPKNERNRFLGGRIAAAVTATINTKHGTVCSRRPNSVLSHWDTINNQSRKCYFDKSHSLRSFLTASFRQSHRFFFFLCLFNVVLLVLKQ